MNSPASPRQSAALPPEATRRAPSGRAPRVVLLSGGVGGARLALGLARALPAGSLTVIVNTGDDFTHWGLAVCPDLDTVMYTLAGLSPYARGWGVEGDSFTVLDAMTHLGADGWFRVGDRDLATHLARTEALGAGQRLTEFTARLARRLGVMATLLPMSDDPCPTLMETRDEGVLPFQRWFVERAAAPALVGVRSGAPALATHEVLSAVADADVVLLGPSNPFVSLEPILDRPGLVALVATKRVVAVSPLLRGRAVKGPLEAMLRQLDGVEPSAAAVAERYSRRGVPLAGFVAEAEDLTGVRVPGHGTDCLMRDPADAERLAREVLRFAESLA